MLTQWGIEIPMRDGTLLTADLFLPDINAPNAKPSPAVLIRTPYGRQTTTLVHQARYFAAHGYAVVNVDVRGRGDSQGEFIPYRNERNDGFDTIEWIAARPWCDENVGTLGGSYLGKVQWLAALEKPPHLKAMIPLVSPSDPFVEWPTGAPVPSHLCWLFLTSGRMVQNIHAVDWDRVYQHLPLLTMDEAGGRKLETWREEFNHLYLDDWWREVCYQDKFDQIDIPVFHISGWYDDEQVGTPLNYVGMVQNSKSSQRLLMGPWPHQVNQSTQVGHIDFGPGSLIDLRGQQVRFFDRFLKGEANGWDEEKPVQIFVMGINKWRSENEWPLARTDYQRWYLREEGALSVETPNSVESFDDYIYDPNDPVPFVTEPTSEQIGGPDDYREIHERRDVLIYTCEPLQEAVEVTGPVKVEIYASSNCYDTDFMAQLHDVWPSGNVQRLCDGMVRVRFRNGMDKPSLLEPGTVHKYEIDCWNISHVFLPGHAIRVHVTSSAFPKYDRNLNTRDDLGLSTRVEVAIQTIYHGKNMPSAVILPVIPAQNIIQQSSPLSRD